MQCVFNEALKQILVQMQSRKSHSLCCVGFKAVGQLSMLLTQAAWHIALISSRTDAFVPKQTQMQPATSRTRLKNILNLVNWRVIQWKRAEYRFWFPTGTACCFPLKPNSVPLSYKTHKVNQNRVKVLICVSKNYFWNYLWATSCNLTPSLIGVVFPNSEKYEKKY